MQPPSLQACQVPKPVVTMNAYRKIAKGKLVLASIATAYRKILRVYGWIKKTMRGSRLDDVDSIHDWKIGDIYSAEIGCQPEAAR